MVEDQVENASECAVGCRAAIAAQLATDHVRSKSKVKML